jgi:hypothetical protein
LEGFSFEPTTTPRGLFYGAKVLLIKCGVPGMYLRTNKSPDLTTTFLNFRQAEIGYFINSLFVYLSYLPCNAVFNAHKTYPGGEVGRLPSRGKQKQV